MTQRAQNQDSSHQSQGFWKRIDALGLWARPKSRRRLTFWTGLGFIAVAALIFFIIRIEGSLGRYLLLAALFIVLILALMFTSLVLIELTRLFRGRRAQSGLIERRLVSAFLIMALVPTIVVALFSIVSLSAGLDGYFSDRVRSTVENSYQSARAYSEELYELLERDGQDVYNYVTVTLNEENDFSQGNLREKLIDAMARQPGLTSGFIIEGNREIYVRGKSSYLFNYIAPTEQEMDLAIGGEIVVIPDWKNNQFRYLRALDAGSVNRYLYVSRDVNGAVLSLLDRTEETAEFYANLDRTRRNLLLLYGAVFLGASIVVLALAFLTAIYLAERITRPIGQLAGAVRRMSSGELNVRVPASNDQDELSILSRSFNTMTEEVRQNQDALREAGARSEAERLRFNSVLEGVSSGVIGLNQDDMITFINAAALSILKAEDPQEGQAISKIAPEFLELVQSARASRNPLVQSQINIMRRGNQETLFVRIARPNGADSDNLIISFDDVSELVQAQRMAAWGDVARRIAHEVKNPLTPIRLSAERMTRRFGKQITEEPEKFHDLANVIIRQTDDLRRIVDEFSKFARMPEAQKTKGDWGRALRDALTLQESGAAGANIALEIGAIPSAVGFYDSTQIGQALTNLIKNAFEAVDAKNEMDRAHQGEVSVSAHLDDDEYVIEIQDNGVGLPADKSKLFEPYVTYKDSGTGLGLPIVKKIIEDHGGRLNITDRDDGESGAKVTLSLPILKQSNEETR